MELPAVRRTQPITIGQNFFQQPLSNCYNGNMVNNNNPPLKEKKKIEAKMRFMEFYSVFIAINLYFPTHQPIPLLINIECCIRCRTLNRYYRLYFKIAIRFRPLMSSDGDPNSFQSVDLDPDSDSI